jgi:2-dehydro-3-deoxyphosphogluconate aldolase/(4S)-4-hydroxy-2-oxoglutarate aldolase
MSALTKLQISSQMLETGIIPVFNHHDIEVCKQVITVCHKAGIKVFEFTNRGDNAFQNFVQLRQFVTTNLRGMTLGVGSIISGKMALEYMKAGADFVVSPIFKKDIANECNKMYKLWIPGCATPTEIVEATDLGAEIVKVFPAETLGPKFVANILAPMPWLKLMPTGGVETNEENLTKWFKAGVVCVGMGTQMLKKDLVEAKDYATLEQNIKGTVEMVKKLKTMYQN